VKEERKEGEKRIEDLKLKHAQLQAMFTKSPTTIVALELDRISTELSDLLYARSVQPEIFGVPNPCPKCGIDFVLSISKEYEEKFNKGEEVPAKCLNCGKKVKIKD